MKVALTLAWFAIFVWLMVLLVLPVGDVESQDLDMDLGTKNPQGSIRFLLNGTLSHEIPEGLAGAMDVKVLSQHPNPPKDKFMRIYALADGLYVQDSRGVQARFALPAPTTTPTGTTPISPKKP